MKDELLKLATLQKFDRECREIESCIKESTKQVEVSQQRLDKARQQLEEKKKEAKIKQVYSDRLDQDMKALELRYKEYNYQLMSLKDAKAYDTMKAQLADLKEEISSTESEAIDVLSALEELNTTVKTYTEKIEEEEKRIEGIKEEMKASLDEKNEELKEQKAKRDAYADTIDDVIVRSYNRLLALPDGKPLAEVHDRTCQGCYSSITLEDLESIKMQERIIHCHSCGRILYIPQLLGVADPS